MDILGRLRGDYPVGAEIAPAKDAQYRPQTLTEKLDEQIAYHELKIKNLKEAKAAVTPEIEKALNALAKL
jgi:hypothetical protein